MVINKRKIKVIFCDEKRNPSSELVAYYGAHDSSAKIRSQINWKEDIRKAVWTEIVTEKIRKQAEYLEYCNCPEADMLYQYINEIEFDDETNREGHAAKVYFNALFGKDFTRTADNSLNAALNYGYSLLLSSFNRSIVSNGYITQLGLFHDNMFNPFNLASDLMEPFRPLVDHKVKQMMPQVFEHEEKVYMLSILQDEVEIAGRKEYVNNAIKIYCKLAQNSTAADIIIENLKKNRPNDGIVQALKVTEKQYNKMDFIVGKRKNDVIDSDERLIIL